MAAPACRIVAAAPTGGCCPVQYGFNSLPHAFGGGPLSAPYWHQQFDYQPRVYGFHWQAADNREDVLFQSAAPLPPMLGIVPTRLAGGDRGEGRFPKRYGGRL